MQAAYITLSILIVIASILLTIVVLLQNSKGGGLAANFAAGNQTFGVRQTADMLEKVTWGLVTFVLVVSIISSFTIGGKANKGDITDKVEVVNNEISFDQDATPVENSEAPTTETETNNE